MSKSLSIVIVTYNSAGDIISCLSSISKNIRFQYEIIIIDNNSFDSTVKKIRDSGFKITILPQEKNLGFSKANNLGAKVAKGDYLLFLNPDTEIIDGSVDKMISFMQEHKKSIVAPKLIMEDGQSQPSVRKLPTLWGAIKEYFLGKKYSYEAYVPLGEKSIEVESVVGAAMLIEKAVFEEVGCFNEQYQLYFEDFDLCRSIKKLGLKIFYLPNVLIKHKIGASSTTNPNSLKLLEKSSSIYHGKFRAFVLHWIIKSSQLFHGLKPYKTILLLAILIRLLLMPILFHPDIKTQYFHANFLSQGVFNIYGFISENKEKIGYTDTFNYPPLTYFMLGSWAIVNKPLLGEPFQNWLSDWGEGWFTNPEIFRQMFILKIPYLFADLLIGLLLVKMLEKQYWKKALIIWFFNPLTLYVIYGLANFDIIPTFFTLLSLFLIKKNKYVWSGLSLGLAIATKLYPLMFLPFFALQLIKSKDLKNLVVFCLSTGGLFLASIIFLLKDFMSISNNGLITKVLSNHIEVLGFFIPIFVIIYGSLLLAFWVSKNEWNSLDFYIMAVGFSVLAVTRFHPQWIIWSLPFFVILTVKNLSNLILFLPVFISYLVLVLTFEDRFLTLGIFSPVLPSIYQVGFIEQTLFSHFDKNLIQFWAQTIFASGVLAISVRELPLWKALLRRNSSI